MNNNPVRYNDPTGHIAAALGTLAFGFSLGETLAAAASAVVAVVTSPAFITALIVVAVVAVVAIVAVAAYDLITDDQVVGVHIEGEGSEDNPIPCRFCGLAKYGPWIAGGIVGAGVAAAACNGIGDMTGTDSCIDTFSKHEDRPRVNPTATPAETPTAPPSSTPMPLPTVDPNCPYVDLSVCYPINTPGPHWDSK